MRHSGEEQASGRPGPTVRVPGKEYKQRGFRNASQENADVKNQPRGWRKAHWNPKVK